MREEGRTPADLAAEFEPSAQSITDWVARAEIDAGRREGLTSDEKTELKRLRQENRVLRMEKEILKRQRPLDALTRERSRQPSGLYVQVQYGPRFTWSGGWVRALPGAS